MELKSQWVLAGLILSSLAWAGCFGESSAEVVASNSAHEKAIDRYTEYIEPLLAKYCYDCHGDGSEKGDVALDAHPSPSELVKDVKLWKRVWENLHRRNMPPGRKPQPGDEERERVMAWIEREVFLFDPSKPDPGRVTIRRLNRTEYDNTIRDLTGVDFQPAQNFPADVSGYGFDNIGDVLTLSPVLFEKYLKSADEIIEKALGSPLSTTKPVQASVTRLRGDGSRQGDVVNLSSNGVTKVGMPFPKSGEYRLRVKAYASRAGRELAKMQIRLSGKHVKTLEVRDEPPVPGSYDATVTIDRPGDREVQVAFINDYYDPRNPNPRRRDRNLYVQSISIIPPPEPKSPIANSDHKILSVRPEAMEDRDYAEMIIGRFSGRAFRRPATASELASLMRLYDSSIDEGDESHLAIRLPLKA
ncbi:MAG: DUF1587 domain-containing protein, partial [Opitutales bacterium]